MKRRDFLLLRVDPRTDEAAPREFELSCRQLYIRWLDADDAGSEPMRSAEPAEPSMWGGEPPAVLDLPTREQILEDLERELRGVDVVRVVDTQWLVGDLKQEVERRIDTFRARGGRVST